MKIICFFHLNLAFSSIPVSTPALEIQLAVYDTVMAKRRGESYKTLAEIGTDMK